MIDYYCPGEAILEFLESNSMTRWDLGEDLHLDEKEMDRLIYGERELTDEMAAQLESFFGASKEFWMELEKNYREDLEKELDKVMYGEPKNDS